MHWLLSDCSLFGLTIQNWMWVFPAVLLLYAAVIVYVRSRHADLRS
jgi:cytochrome c-type biogenesis protein CcmH/NrfF